MGEAKRRKELGLPPRKKPIELPKLDKDSIQKKVKSFLYKNPIIPFIFYGALVAAFVWGLFTLVKVYKFICYISLFCVPTPFFITIFLTIYPTY